MEMTGQEAEGSAPLADPPQVEPTTNTVLMRLREMIVTGQIPPETRLRAEGLATELAVSRTPIRSALAVLSAEGLVDYSVNRGYTVRAVTISDIFDAIEVRARLEGQAARLSIELGWEPGALDQLAKLARRGRAILEQGDWSEAAEVEWYRLNHAFHRAIQYASENTVLRNAIKMTLIYPVLGDPARLCPSVAAAVPLRFRQLSATPPAHLLASQADHERIIDAFRRDDAALAEMIMTEHVLATKRRLHAIATRR
ncbi:GntR family transcriptional regulator [Caulobacter segnis]|nr:GntR family transcriptional regulator [Caulobacter segnis]